MSMLIRTSIALVLAASLGACTSDSNSQDTAFPVGSETQFRNSPTEDQGPTLNAAQATESNEVQEFVINSLVITESSGLARSHLNKDILWTHNDSGGNVAIYGITKRGAHVASYSVQGIGVINLDWEDMTSAVIDGKSFLFVADVGDNNAFRPFTTIYMMPEPEFQIPRFGIVSDVVNVSAIYNLVFPDASPKDVESLGIDGANKTGYIISKREAQPRLFSFSLENITNDIPSPIPPTPVTVIMEDLGPINIPRAPSDFKGNPEDFNWVTTMDFSRDGLMAYVGTLMHGYIYRRNSNVEDWKTAFSRKPVSIRLPAYSQIEAGAFDVDGRSVFITSENYPGRMARIPVSAFRPLN